MDNTNTNKLSDNAQVKWDYHTELDTEELGCGDLVMELYKFFKTLDPGTIVKLRSLDPGDVMAWCRSTGNKMHASEPPFFLIEKK